MPTKAHLVNAMVFPVVMYGYESWTIKKTDCGRIEAFELWCWRKLLRVPWTARRSNQSIQKEINPEHSLERLLLKLQYFDHLMQRANSLDKTLIMEKIEGRRRRWWQSRDGVEWHHRLNGNEFEQTQGDCEGQGSLVCCSPWAHKELDMTEWLNNKWLLCAFCFVPHFWMEVWVVLSHHYIVDMWDVHD